MAIAFNLPSDDDTDARYETLNRILLELCELLRTIMTARNNVEAQNSVPRATRPLSESTLPRMPDLLLHGSSRLPRRRICSVQTPPASPSCSAQHLSRTFSEAFDTDFNDPSMAYFGDDEVFCRDSDVRSSFPPRHRRRRRRSSSVKESKKKTSPTVTKPKGDDWNANSFYVERKKADLKRDEKDDTDPPKLIILEDKSQDQQEQGTLFGTFLSNSLGRPLWTAVVLVVGWKLLATKR